MPITKKSISIFEKIANRAPKDPYKRILNDGGALYATDGVLCLRSSSFQFLTVSQSAPDDAAPLRKLFDDVEAASYQLAATAPKADYHGGKPVIAENLRAYVRFAKSQGSKLALYPLGDSFVNAALLADVLDAIPDACVYFLPGQPLKSLYFRGQYAEGILCPVRPLQASRGVAILSAYQAETGERGANVDKPLQTLAFSALCQAEEAEAQRREEIRAAQEAERQKQQAQRRQAEEAEAAENARQHAAALQSLRQTLQSDCHKAPVDGALLCELAESLHVSIPLRTKGWILQKLRAVTLQGGEVTSVSFQPTRKHEQGSEKAFSVINAVISALKMESLAQSCDGIPEKKDPQPENQPKKVQNPIPNTQNIPLPAFQARFAQEYNFLYDCRGNVPGCQEAVSAFATACQDPAFMDFVRRFVQYRDGDPVSSDRECAAFMRALEALNHPPANPSRPYLNLLTLSAGTVATLARQKGHPCESYDDINCFHSAVTLTACFMDCTRFENWQQLFEAAYAIAFPQNNGGQSCNQPQNLPSVTKSAEKCDANAQNSTEISAKDTAPAQKNTPPRPKKKRRKQPGKAQKRKAAAQTFRIFLDYDVQHFGHVRPETYDAIQSQKHRRKGRPSKLAAGPG